MRRELTRRQVVKGVIQIAGAMALAGADTSPAAATPPAERSRFMARAFEMRRIAVERGDRPMAPSSCGTVRSSAKE